MKGIMEPKVLVGKTLGSYKIIKYITKGAQAWVYEGIHKEVENHKGFAIKVLMPKWANKQEFIERFRREARNGMTLQHGNLLRVYDNHLEQDGNLHYMVMEYARGGTLQQLLKKRPLSLREITTIVAQIADGLQAAHAQEIVHRDVKPANVLFLSNGTPMLADFGIALNLADTRLTDLGDRRRRPLGTPKYMSPEQAKGGLVDHRSDIYSLGLMLYEMLKSKLRLEGKDTPRVINHKINYESICLPQDSNIPQRLQDIISKSLMKEPDQRWNSAQEMAHALRHPKVATKSLRDILPLIFAFILVLVAVLIGVTIALLLETRAPVDPLEVIITVTIDPNETLVSEEVRGTSEPTGTPIPYPSATATAIKEPTYKPTVPTVTRDIHALTVIPIEPLQPTATFVLPTATLPLPTATLTPQPTPTLPPPNVTFGPLATITFISSPTATLLPSATATVAASATQERTNIVISTEIVVLPTLPTEPPPPTDTPIPEHPGYNNTSPLPTEPINGKIMREETMQFFWEWNGVELASGHKFAIYAVRDNLNWTLAATADGSARSAWASMSAVGGGQFETDWRWYMVILDRNNSPVEGTRSAEYNFGLTLR
jgi:serine/threonine protein kinase